MEKKEIYNLLKEEKSDSEKAKSQSISVAATIGYIAINM